MRGTTHASLHPSHSPTPPTPAKQFKHVKNIFTHIQKCRAKRLKKIVRQMICYIANSVNIKMNSAVIYQKHLVCKSCEKQAKQCASNNL